MRSTGVVTEAVWVLTLAISKLQTKRGRGTNRLGGFSQGGGAGRRRKRRRRKGGKKGGKDSNHERAGSRIRSVDEGDRRVGERRGRERKKGKMRVKGGTCYVLKKRNNKRVFHDLMGKTLLRV